MRYIVTIIDRKSQTVANLERTEDTINSCIEKELNGWDNLFSASTSGPNNRKGEYFIAGTTKDDLKCFSILCIK